MASTESNAAPERPGDGQIAELIEAQRRSGMSIAAFARKHGVSAWKLYQAGRKRRRRRKPPAQFVEVAVSPKATEASPLELVFQGGMRLRVPPGRRVALTFTNSDPSMPHNFVLVRSDRDKAIGDAAMTV